MDVTAVGWFCSHGEGAGSFWGNSPSPGIGCCWFAHWAPFVEGGGRPKTETATPVGRWQVCKQGNSLTGSSWVPQDKEISVPSCQILKFIERPEVGSVTMLSGWPQHITVSRPRPWGSPRVGKASRAHIPRTKEGVGSLRVPGSSSQVNQRSCPLVLDDFLQLLGS